MQMTKAMLQPQIDELKMIHGVTRRIIDQIPPDQINYRPFEGVRTFAETVEHMYAFVEEVMIMIETGKFYTGITGNIHSKADLLAFVDERFTNAMAKWENITDEQLQVNVKAWGWDFQAWQFIGHNNDEIWHHRGALTIYLRGLGIQPVMIYDYQ